MCGCGCVCVGGGGGGGGGLIKQISIAGTCTGHITLLTIINFSATSESSEAGVIVTVSYLILALALTFLL